MHSDHKTHTEMKTSAVTIISQIYLPKHSNLTTPSTNPPSLMHFKTKPSLKLSPKPPPSPASSRPAVELRRRNHMSKLAQNPSGDEFSEVSPCGFRRLLLFGGIGLGVVVLMMGMEDQRAMALGPEGPLMEEFWDNVRRYGLYILTVSTGAIYTVFQPIMELLKNPISAILVLVILGGSVYIVSQVLSAMVGVSDFTYDYGY